MSKRSVRRARRWERRRQEALRRAGLTGRRIDRGVPDERVKDVSIRTVSGGLPTLGKRR